MALGNYPTTNVTGHHPIPTVWAAHVDWSCQCGTPLGQAPWRASRRGKPPVIEGAAAVANLAHRTDVARSCAR